MGSWRRKAFILRAIQCYVIEPVSAGQGVLWSTSGDVRPIELMC